MTVAELAQCLSGKCAALEWYPNANVLYASFGAERLRIRADSSGVAWAYEERFDRWANSRDAHTLLPRDEERFAAMLAYLAARRDYRGEVVPYRDAEQWAKSQTKAET